MQLNDEKESSRQTGYTTNLELETLDLPRARWYQTEFKALLDYAGSSQNRIAALDAAQWGSSATGPKLAEAIPHYWEAVCEHLGPGRLIVNPQSRLAAFIRPDDSHTFLHARPYPYYTCAAPLPRTYYPPDTIWSEKELLRWEPEFHEPRKWPEYTQIYKACFLPRLEAALKDSDYELTKGVIDDLGAIFAARALNRLVEISTDHAVLFSIGQEKQRLSYFAAPTAYYIKKTGFWCNHDGTEREIWDNSLKGGAEVLEKGAGSFIRGFLSGKIDSAEGFLRLDIPGNETMLTAYCARKGITAAQYAAAITVEFGFVAAHLLSIAHPQKPAVLLENIRALLAQRGVTVEERLPLATLIQKLGALQLEA